jgi:hypothetical protein
MLHVTCYIPPLTNTVVLTASIILYIQKVISLVNAFRPIFHKKDYNSILASCRPSYSLLSFCKHNKCNPHSASSLATLCPNNRLSSPRILNSKYYVRFLLFTLFKRTCTSPKPCETFHYTLFVRVLAIFNPSPKLRDEVTPLVLCGG